jgi:hypothetical protein
METVIVVAVMVGVISLVVAFFWAIIVGSWRTGRKLGTVLDQAEKDAKRKERREARRAAIEDEERTEG